MIKQIVTLIIALAIVFVPVVYGKQKKMNKQNIIESYNLSPLDNLLDTADENTLVIFDVKSVLIIEQDLILQPPNKKEFKKLKDLMYTKLSKEKADELYSTIISQRKLTLVDKKLLKIFETMRNKNVKYIALTSGKTGKFGAIEKREDLRIEILKDLGIDFSNSYPNIKPIIFKDIGKNINEKPMYKNGILFTSREDKGTILKQFFDHEKINVNKIIFLDNQMKNISSVGRFCDQAKIEYIGIHYQDVVNRKVLPLDNKIADYQFKVLLEQNKWISDAEAKKILSPKQVQPVEVN